MSTTLNSYNVRIANEQDVPQLVEGVHALLIELSGNPNTKIPDDIAKISRQMINGDIPGAIFIAHPQNDINRMSGFLSLTIQTALRTGGPYALIQELWVQPLLRSHRIGKSLLEAAENYCHNKHLGKLEVGLPSEKFQYARRTYDFYHSAGFSHIGPRMRRDIP